MDHDVESITQVIAETLEGDSEELSKRGYEVIPLLDLGEIFLRTPNGATFKITVEESDEEVFDGEDEEG
jgi:hypothetical protein